MTEQPSSRASALTEFLHSCGLRRGAAQRGSPPAPSAARTARGTEAGQGRRYGTGRARGTAGPRRRKGPPTRPLRLLPLSGGPGPGQRRAGKPGPGPGCASAGGARGKSRGLLSAQGRGTRLGSIRLQPRCTQSPPRGLPHRLLTRSGSSGTGRGAREPRSHLRRRLHLLRRAGPPQPQWPPGAPRRPRQA